MKINKKTFFAVTVAFELIAAIFILCKISFIKKSAESENRIYRFECNFYDPFNPMKGRYVQLTFAEEKLPGSFYDEICKEEKWILPGQTVYALLSKDENGIDHVTVLSLKKPQNRNCIKAKFDRYVKSTTDEIESSYVFIKFDFDRFYLQEEHADYFDRMGRDSEHPLNIELYSDGEGNVIQKELYIYDKDFGYIPLIEYYKKQHSNSEI